jgi:peptide deformylase
MAVVDIRIIGDPILRERAREVGSLTPEIEEIFKNMIDTMFAYKGLGLAAPQIGHPLRLIVVNREALEIGDSPLLLINPEVIHEEGEDISEEGCLSIPGLYTDLKRPQKIVIRAKEVKNKRLKAVEIEAEGLFARTLLHEIDHINGILFIDRLPLEERIYLLAKWKKELRESRVQKGGED